MRRCFDLAMIWAQQIVLGNKTYDQVPKLLKSKVAEILHSRGMDELIIDD